MLKVGNIYICVYIIPLYTSFAHPCIFRRDGCFHDKSFFKLGADEVICPYVCWRFDMAPSTVLHFAELCILDLSCLDLFSQVSPFYSYLFMYHVNGFLFLALFSYQSHPPAAASGRKLRPSSKPTAIPGGWGGGRNHDDC